MWAKLLINNAQVKGNMNFAANCIGIFSSKNAYCLLFSAKIEISAKVNLKTQ